MAQKLRNDTEPPPPKGCAWWMPKKRRFCASPALPASEFCGNHRSCTGLTRVACPVDPSHTVLEADVESHVKKCSATKQLDYIERQPYFCYHLNAGSDEECDSLSSPGHRNAEDNCARGAPLHEENRSCDAKRSDFSGISPDQFAEFVKRIELAHDKCALGNEEESFCSLLSVPNGGNRNGTGQRLPFQEKHVSQQASLLGNLLAFGLLKAERGKSSTAGGAVEEGETDAVFVEFGAGSGYLGHILCDSYGISSLVLVERRAYKFKADRTLRQLLGVSLERLRIDIEDLSIRGIQSIRGRRFVAVSKHLCGPATDLTLRCCINGRRAPLSKSDDSEAQCDEPILEGIGIATCCHHLCQWRSYVNKNYFRTLGFREREFNMITWLTSWAVNSNGQHDHCEAESRSHMSTNRNRDNKPEKGKDFKKVEVLQALKEDLGVVGERKHHLPEVMRDIDPTERTILGRKCKDLLDHGRLLWLKESGQDVKIVKYVPAEITPENRLLLGRWTTNSRPTLERP